MCGCESWTIKKAEHCRIDAFDLWCWSRLWRVSWTARRSNQSILKEINPEYSLEGLMLKLKLQCFGHLMQRTDSLEKTLMLGKTEGRRRRGWQRMRWLDGITKSMDMSFSKLREILKDREAWHSVVHGVTKVGYDLATEQQQLSLNYVMVQWLRLWASTAGGKDLIFGRGTRISYAEWLGQKNMNHGYGMYGVGNIAGNYVISLYGNILWLRLWSFWNV